MCPTKQAALTSSPVRARRLHTSERAQRQLEAPRCDIMAAPPSSYKDRQFLAVIGDEVCGYFPGYGGVGRS